MRIYARDRLTFFRAAFVGCLGVIVGLAAAEDKTKPSGPTKDGPQGAENTGSNNLAERRLEVMKSRVQRINFSSPEANFPQQLQPTPLFRYEDQPRGYVDGTVWRLGERGRPLALITSELHPNYLNGGPRIVYDFLSLTEVPFTAKSADVPGWKPRGSAMALKRIPDAPEPANAATPRLGQMKQLARRFSATQEVTELETTFVHLRLLPREIDRYSPGPKAESDGAIFLFVNGRNPAIVLLIETSGEEWTYGVGRLSAPSTLTMRLDDTVVWKEPSIFNALSWSNPYTASNSAATFP